MAATIEHLVADANAQIPANWRMPQNDGGATEFLVGSRRGVGRARRRAGRALGGPRLLRQRRAAGPPPSDPTPPAEPERCRTPVTRSASGRRWAATQHQRSADRRYWRGCPHHGGHGRLLQDRRDLPDQYDRRPRPRQRLGRGRHAVADQRWTMSRPTSPISSSNPSIYDRHPAHAAGPNWIVDKVDGNYYSVHAVAQTNYLSDNDVATQVSGSSHYNLVERPQ